MLFSRKNAALVAAFMAPAAFAQTSNTATNPTTGPDSCKTAGNAVFNLGATQGAGTVGELALQVTAGSTPCTPNGGAANSGQTIGVVTGNFGANQITFTPGSGIGTISDNCLQPCNTAGPVLSPLGFTFTTGSTTNNNLLTYQVRANGQTLQVYPVNTAGGAPTVGGTASANAVNAGNACNSPSAGAAVCDASQTCDSNNNRFFAFQGTDANGGAFKANVGFSSLQSGCAAINGVPGYTVTSLTGTYQMTGQVTPERLALTQGVTSCFYPCGTAIVDATNGISFTVTAGNTGTVVTGLRFNSGGANGAYRITPASGNSVAVTQQSLVGSCASGTNAFFACAVSSSSSVASTSSSAAVVSIPSVSIPSVSVPVTLASSSVTTAAVIISSTASSSAASSVIVTIPTSSAAASVSATRSSSSSASTTVALATSATGPQTSLPTPFVITVNARASLKRQAVQYIGDGGALTSDPTAAAVFQLINGQLFSDGQIVSTGPQIPAQQPLDGGAQGTVTTVWTSNNGAIAWSNVVFANGAASFCIANNIVNTVFVAAPAAGCVPAALTGVSLSAVVPAVASGAAAGGITINNNFNPTIGVIVTVNIVLGTSTLGNGTVITTTGLSSSTSPLYAAASNGAYCLPCHMSAVGVACPSSGNVVYTTACAACAAYTAAPAAVVTCPTCAPVALPAATGAAAAAPAANAAAPVAPAGTAGAAPVTTFTGSAVSFGISAAAVMVAGAALLL